MKGRILEDGPCFRKAIAPGGASEGAGKCKEFEQQGAKLAKATGGEDAVRGGGKPLHLVVEKKMKDSPPACGWRHGNTEKQGRMLRTFQMRKTHLRQGSGGQAASEMCATRLGRGAQREKACSDASNSSLCASRKAWREFRPRLARRSHGGGGYARGRHSRHIWVFSVFYSPCFRASVVSLKLSSRQPIRKALRNSHAPSSMEIFLFDTDGNNPYFVRLL